MKILERILLWTILPVEANFEDLICIEDIRKKINVTQEEIKKHKIRTNEKTWNIQWDDKKDKWKKVDFTESETRIIKESLKKLNDEKKLNSNMITLYKQFN